MYLNIDIHNKTSCALVDDTKKRVSYGELSQFCAAIKNSLETRTVVFLLCNNTIGAMIWYLSFVDNDIVPLLLNASIDEDFLLRLYTIYKPEYIAFPKNKRSTVFNRLSISRIVFDRYDYIVLKTNNPKRPIHKDVSLLMSTSGSTGTPKVVKYKRINLEANARNVAKAFGWTKTEKPICDLPMHYTMGLSVINSHLHVGASVVLTDYNLMSSDYWDLIKQEKCTNITGVPFSYSIMSKLRIYNKELPSLRTLAQGGGKLSDKEFQMWAEYAERNGKRFIASYGATETAARMACLPPPYATSKTGSIGFAIPEGRLSLLDINGNEIQELEAEGELLYEGPNVSMGYASNRLELELGDAFNGKYRTGDIARRDKDGFYYITGRKTRFIKLLGKRISLDECERIIKDHFSFESVCIGFDDRMIIYIVSKKCLDEVKRYLSYKLKLHDSLFEVISISEIPRTKTGKILYKALPS